MLGFVLSHWNDFQLWARNLSVEVKNKKLWTLCSSECPIFDVGWPWEGTFDLSIVVATQQKVFRAGTIIHLDQVPYIVVWRDFINCPSLLHSKFPSQ